MGFARKETDSYRDSGLAQPKGGKQGEMGVYGGLVNLTVPLFTHELLPAHQREWAENRKHTRTSEAPFSAGGLASESQSGTWRQNWSLFKGGAAMEPGVCLTDSCLQSGQITAMLY